MRGEAFKLVAQLQAKIEDCAEDWHLAPMWGHSWTHKLFPFYLANIVTLHVHQINMVSQIFDTHKGRCWQLYLPNANEWSTSFPSLRYKVQLIAQSFQHLLFRNKYASPRTKFSHANEFRRKHESVIQTLLQEHLECWNRDCPCLSNQNSWWCTYMTYNADLPTTPISYYAYHPLCPKPEKQHFKVLTEQFGQITKSTSPE